MSRPISLTGTAVLSAAGVGADPILEAMAGGRTLLRAPTGTHQSAHPPAHPPDAGPWPSADLPDSLVTWPSGPRWADLAKYANAATRTAVAVARLLPPAPPAPDRCGVVLAAGISGTEELGSDDRGGLYPALAADALTDPRPLPLYLFDELPEFSYLRGIPSLAGQLVALATGYTASSVAVCGETDPGGLGALALAARLIATGELDRVLLVGVAPPLSATARAALDREEPLARAVGPGAGPFDTDRTGWLMGSGAVALHLEAAGTAERRGAAILARLVACEALCAPTYPRALTPAVEAVLHAGSAAGHRAPDLWWAHGGGGPRDVDEARVGARLLSAPVTAAGGTVGRPVECAGLIDLALAARVLGTTRVPPIGLLRRPDPAVAGVDLVAGAARTVPPIGSVLVTSTCPGAQTATAGAALLARATPGPEPGGEPAHG